MNLVNFETQYRNVIEQNLDQLQTLVLLMAQLQNQTSGLPLAQIEDRIINIGRELQNVSQSLEEIITQKMAESI